MLSLALGVAACGDAAGPTTQPDDTVRIDVIVSGGAVSGGGDVEVTLGEPVVLTVTSDVADEVHIHGYDILGDVAPGATVTIDFVADLPGIFEIELEDARLAIVALVVAP